MNSLNKILLCKKFWISLAIIMIGIYLYPLFSTNLYVPTFDNLDSNVVWYKILAHSSHIFAPNDTIIPNMMNGLPRASYGSEFDLILWLYYFLEPKTAFIINEIFIHIIAFIGSYLLLSKYIVPKSKHYSYMLVYIGSIYFTILPFWSGAGASIASLPFTTYILLDIKNRIDTKWHWIYLLLLPLYSSLVFLYMFYIIYAGLYWIYDAIKHKHIDWRFFSAVFLLGSAFLLKDYRLVYAMFIDNNFISHRVEFDIFFKETLWESYRLALVNFLQGHVPHSQSFQQTFVLPISLIAIVLSLFKNRFDTKTSLIVWSIILLSFIYNLWDIVLIHKFTLPGIAILSIIVFLTRKRYRFLPLLILFVMGISILGACFEYKGLHFIIDTLPIFKALNMIRLTFIEPLIYTIVLILSFLIYIKKLRFTTLLALPFILITFNYSIKHSFYQTKPQEGYASFENYYAQTSFDKLITKAKSIDKNFDITKSHFVSFGMEPAIALYNNLYTVDGYSTNYPLPYKYAFRKVFAPFHTSHLYDIWGSKVYIVSILTDKRYYNKGLKIKRLRFDTNALCNLHTNYILSPYLFDDPSYNKQVKLMTSVKGEKDSWDLYLYKLICK